MKKQNKLYTPKWKLWLKKLKYWLFVKRPVPLLMRQKCKTCKIVWNPELFRGCPLCGRGPNKVWVVIWHNEIEGVFRDPDDAEYLKQRIANESEEPAKIEDWEVK